MSAGMVGANADALDAAAAELSAAAEDFDRSAGVLAASLGSMNWLGAVAIRFTDLWNSAHQPAMFRTASYLRENADRLRQQAKEQRAASEDHFGVGGHWPSPFVAGDPNQHALGHESRVVTFGGEHGLLDRGQRLKPGEFEILKVSDNPPRYIVNLRGIDWTLADPWQQEHLQDLESAQRARLYGDDDYAARVKLEMQRAGIPPGAEVMIVGHSYGAIAAMNIAKDHTFNQPGNDSSSGAYHVQVTHVMAAGAGLRDWVDDPPQGTNVMMVINRNDLVAQGVQVGDFGIPQPPNLGHVAGGFVNDVFDIPDAQSSPQGAGRLVMEFSANAKPLLYHDYDNYKVGLNAADGPGEAWMNDAAHKYFAGGGQMQVLRVSVPDSIDYGGVP